MLGAVVQYKAEKILFDVRNVTGKPADMERFCYGDFVARATHRIVRAHGIVPRFAYVAHVPLRDPERFGETVAVNRGRNVKIFETPEDAFEWLTNPRLFAGLVESNRDQREGGLSRQDGGQNEDSQA